MFTPGAGAVEIVEVLEGGVTESVVGFTETGGVLEKQLLKLEEIVGGWEPE